MHRLAQSLVLTALAACCGAAIAATPADGVPHGRLPRWAAPESYQLAFKVDPAQQDFTGTTTIKLALKQAADHIWINGRDLNVGKVTITDASGRQHAGKYVTVDMKAGVARVDLGNVLQPQTITLTLDYTAPLNQQLQGLYKVNHAGTPYAMTQMEPVSARFAFPGFDEPDFKTPYDIALTIPSALTGVANTSQISETPAGGAWKTLQFARTQPLPTYLVAFAVGPWDVVNGPTITADSYRSEPLPLRGVATQGEGHRMQHVLSETPSIIHTLENYYGFGYPFGKLDLLAAPDFSAGAMENPGLVTFRDWFLLLDPQSPTKNVRDSFNVTAHELAHQWTGDTVTLAWWDDLWLNEAFATWMQQKVTMKVHPEYRADLDRIAAAENAMENDSLVSARKIRQPITGIGDIETAFDNITYRKGAAVLGMFEGYVGEDVFQKGMRAYIQQHKFGNATADDLIDAIATTANQGTAFKQAFDSFLNQAGVPYVQTTLEHEGGKTILHLSQGRYLPIGSTGDATRVWGIPVCVRYGTTSSSKTQCEMLDKPEGTMVLADAGTSAWVMPNANARGYYRFSMSKPAWADLTKHVDALNDGEQLAYADSIDAGFRRGDLDASDVLTALQPLATAKTREVAVAPLSTVMWIYRYEANTDAQRTAIADWVTKAYLPRMEQLGYQRKAGEADGDSLLRTTLAHALALDFNVPEVRTALLKQGDAALSKKQDGSLNLAAADPDLLGDALAVAVQERGKPAVDALIAELPRTTDPALRNAMLAALSAANTPELANEARDFAITKQVKVGEMAAILRGGRDTPAARDALWQWFTAHYDQVLGRTGSFASGFVPRLAGGGGCSTAEADRLDTYFKPRLKDLAGADRGLAQTREQILLCAALKAKQDSAAILR
ncbi:M1 family metallopeptidase [Dyella nitratireducens]|uniref:Aminopeptidase n=1 Tax=Dyella nitratireducens TaxID=1849580 RepID=A0ABQ1G038_9GAMM|nr:M1 family metallopeptidase [Dyella nitratireducens]GGA34030.1 aminopeptidase [Dyella nitratireducens]GLQ40805.1 aminopeptidase [Dyella nitratireducens]